MPPLLQNAEAITFGIQDLGSELTTGVEQNV
jgi:hypothetical protein